MKAKTVLYGLLPTFVSAAAPPLPAADLARAMLTRPLPTSHVVGANGKDIFGAMNQFLLSQPVGTAGQHVATRPCEDWNHQELNELARVLYKARSPALTKIYVTNSDRRQFHFEDSQYKDKLWLQEEELVSTRPHTHGEGSEPYAMTRDGKCAEMIMWWVHHLPKEQREVLANTAEFVVPLLPAHGFREVGASVEYNDQVSCSVCHNTNTTEGPASVPLPPVWPDNVRYIINNTYTLGTYDVVISENHANLNQTLTIHDRYPIGAKRYGCNVLFTKDKVWQWGEAHEQRCVLYYDGVHSVSPHWLRDANFTFISQTMVDGRLTNIFSSPLLYPSNRYYQLVRENFPLKYTPIDTVMETYHNFTAIAPRTQPWEIPSYCDPNALPLYVNKTFETLQFLCTWHDDA